MTVGRRALLGGLGVLAAPSTLLAQAGYPDRPVRVVNAYSPGGTADVICRVLFTAVSAATRRSFVVENRPGAAGTVAAAAVARARADGYTLLYDATTHAVNPALFGARLAYDTQRDLAPVFQAMVTPNTFVATNRFPARTVAELIALAKERPGEIDCATTGVGTGQHISLELLNSLAGIRLNHVPYRDLAAAQNDVVAGRVPLLASNVPNSVMNTQAGTARTLAHCGIGTLSALPGVPAVADTLPGFETYEWNGVFAPAGAPAEAVGWLNAALSAAVGEPAVQERLTQLGVSARPNTVAEFTAFRDAQIALNARVVREAGIRLE
jgi:tripartite-type tricarboxylate transporter receptor subunit TctC